MSEARIPSDSIHTKTVTTSPGAPSLKATLRGFGMYGKVIIRIAILVILRILKFCEFIFTLSKYPNKNKIPVTIVFKLII